MTSLASHMITTQQLQEFSWLQPWRGAALVSTEYIWAVQQQLGVALLTSASPQLGVALCRSCASPCLLCRSCASPCRSWSSLVQEEHLEVLAELLLAKRSAVDAHLTVGAAED